MDDAFTERLWVDDPSNSLFVSAIEESFSVDSPSSPELTDAENADVKGEGKVKEEKHEEMKDAMEIDSGGQKKELKEEEGKAKAEEEKEDREKAVSKFSDEDRQRVHAHIPQLLQFFLSTSEFRNKPLLAIGKVC